MVRFLVVLLLLKSVKGKVIFILIAMILMEKAWIWLGYGDTFTIAKILLVLMTYDGRVIVLSLQAL